jgi:hypothetical protein
MPNAAHRRSDKTCGGNGCSEYSRLERRSRNASIKGFPPWLWGAGNTTGCAASTEKAGITAAAAVDKRPIPASRRVMI